MVLNALRMAPVSGVTDQNRTSRLTTLHARCLASSVTCWRMTSLNRGETSAAASAMAWSAQSDAAMMVLARNTRISSIGIIAKKP